MIRVVQMRHKCIGCYACVEVHPSRWSMSRRDGKSILIDSKAKGDYHVAVVHDEERQANERAARSCPVKIIQVL